MDVLFTYFIVFAALQMDSNEVNVGQNSDENTEENVDGKQH